MNFGLISFIVRRFVFSKKNRGIVHIISLVSLVGVAVVSACLVLVLSVFNGFTSVAKDMLKASSPAIMVSARQGNTIEENLLSKIKNIDKVEKCFSIVEQNALLSFGDNKTIATIYGIDSNYFSFNRLDTSLVVGQEYFCQRVDTDFCLLSIGVAVDLGLNKGAEKMNLPIQFTVIAKEDEEDFLPEDRLSSLLLPYRACYQTRTDLDEGIAFVSLYKAKQLLEIDESMTNDIYILTKDEDIAKVQKQLTNILDTKKYKIENIFEQQPLYFRIVKSEKLAIYIILAFIVFIALINVITAIIIMYIEKSRDNYVFLSMGMRPRFIKSIYFYYGLTISFIGCLIGILLGLVLCFMQQRFGLIGLNQQNYVVDSYPINIVLWDIIKIFSIVMALSTICIGIVCKSIKVKK